MPKPSFTCIDRYYDDKNDLGIDFVREYGKTPMNTLYWENFYNVQFEKWPLFQPLLTNFGDFFG